MRAVCCRNSGIIAHLEVPARRRMDHSTLEIERRYLLRELPELPAGARVTEIEQGYFSHGDVDPHTGSPLNGRLRCARLPDGSAVYTHTIKRGTGLVREETERQIDQTMFNRLWPLTEPLRLTKTRHAVDERGVTWEIDAFDDVDLVLAEVELDSADASVTIPAWLRPVVEREVTNDPAFTSKGVARRIAAARSGLH